MFNPSTPALQHSMTSKSQNGLPFRRGRYVSC
jgi:hypothetical protein